jgi:hypothetical protein
VQKDRDRGGVKGEVSSFFLYFCSSIVHLATSTGGPQDVGYENKRGTRFAQFSRERQVRLHSCRPTLAVPEQHGERP